MNWSELVTIAAAFIVSLGGGGAIVLDYPTGSAGFSPTGMVEKLKHEIHQEIESYKTKLKKSEFLFQKEFEAASQFISLCRGLLPKYRFPDMDWEDACADFAGKFALVEEELNRYMATHGAALKQQPLDRLAGAIAEAASGKFEVSRDGVSTQGLDTARKVIKELEEVEKRAS